MNATHLIQLQEIFAKQRSLTGNYEAIYTNNGHPFYEPPIDINHTLGQAQLKRGAWCFTEEMAEAHARMYSVDGKACFEDAGYREELIDALHFLTEFCIYADITGEDVFTILRSLPEKAGNDVSFTWPASRDFMAYMQWQCVACIASACNLLKNRPWKQTFKNTDRPSFVRFVLATWKAFYDVCQMSGMTAEDIHAGYMAKHRVNEQRQATGY
jgi:hypothetical protein